jgi:hypothetical protein
MMKAARFIPLAPALALLLELASAAVQGAETSKSLSLHQVPAVVKTAIEEHAEGWKLGEIVREENDGEVTFTASIGKGGKESSFKVAEDGFLLSVELELEDLPAAVQKTINAQVGDGTMESIEKNFEEAEPSYDVEFTRQDGAERFLSVGEDGKLKVLEIALDETPPAVRKTIEANLRKGKLKAVYRLSEKEQISYDAEIAVEEKQRDVVVRSDGKLQSVQVFLSETPAPVQETSRARLGEGKLLRIDKSFEQRMGVQPYEVEARKGGKPFNFSVGPRGRFLGRDE